MVKLKNKIKPINSLREEKKEKMNISTIIISISSLLIFLTLIILFIYKSLPYLRATNINKIEGKKINITECNNKDYIIINKDKSYTMSLTNDDCISNHYEGTLIIKDNTIIFNNNIKGLIDNNYNIIINNKIFESDNNEWRNKKYIKQH